MRVDPCQLGGWRQGLHGFLELRVRVCVCVSRREDPLQTVEKKKKKKNKTSLSIMFEGAQTMFFVAIDRENYLD